MRSIGVAVWLGAVSLAAGTLLWHARAAARAAGRPVSTAIPATPLRPVSDEEMWG